MAGRRDKRRCGFWPGALGSPVLKVQCREQPRGGAGRTGSSRLGARQGPRGLRCPRVCRTGLGGFCSEPEPSTASLGGPIYARGRAAPQPGVWSAKVTPQLLTAKAAGHQPPEAALLRPPGRSLEAAARALCSESGRAPGSPLPSSPPAFPQGASGQGQCPLTARQGRCRERRAECSVHARGRWGRRGPGSTLHLEPGPSRLPLSWGPVMPASILGLLAGDGR